MSGVGGFALPEHRKSASSLKPDPQYPKPVAKLLQSRRSVSSQLLDLVYVTILVLGLTWAAEAIAVIAHRPLPARPAADCAPGPAPLASAQARSLGSLVMAGECGDQASPPAGH
jgi:hypothetical protein